jgi:hypothetical protein
MQLTHPVWPVKVAVHLAVKAFHLTRDETTSKLLHVRVFVHVRVRVAYILMVPSQEPEYTLLPWILTLITASV